jgi:hypothetical protein
MHFEPEGFVSFPITILENGGILVTVNTTVAFWMVSLDITGFEGQKSLNICWRYQSLITPIMSSAGQSP